VVVPVYNGAAVIGRCLDALAAQAPPDPTLEIIVVDDGSTDGTATLVEAWAKSHPQQQVRLVRQANAGPAAARNAGARLATGDLLLLTDADCIPAAGWVSAFRAAFEAPSPAGAPDAAMGAYSCAQTAPAARFAQLEFEERYAHMARRASIDLIATYSAAYRRTLFLQAGGFDGAFPKANNEDVEFSYRLSEMGARMIFVPAARVWHEHDASWGGYLRTKRWRGYWRTVVYRRFPGKGVKDSYTPQVIKLQMPLAMVALRAVVRALFGGGLGRLMGVAPFLLSTAPMVRFARQQRDPALRSVAIWVPWGSFVRAVAFVWGVGEALLRAAPLATARTGALTPESGAPDVKPAEVGP
jgi:glycosyltransferase involved in cell wall biosynthesis